MKYELTKETKRVHGITLHRIKALRDIERYDVKTGDLGGWVERENNLSQSGDAWVTIMSNLNIVAVASLADPSCIVLSESVELDDGVKERAEQQSVNIVRSSKDTFSVCAEIAAAL